MTPELVCGIDPGQSGGIALLTLQGEIVGVWAMPATELETVELLAEFSPRIAKAAIERLQPMFATSKVTMFKLGRSYGFLRGILTVLQVPFDEIQPKDWQKRIGCIYQKASKHKDRKAVNRQKAQQLWPGTIPKIDDATADALLIAETQRRQL